MLSEHACDERQVLPEQVLAIGVVTTSLTSIFRRLVEWGLVAALPVSWLGLCRLGVTACRVSSRGGRAFPGARGFFLQGRGGQEAGAVCLRSR